MPDDEPRIMTEFDHAALQLALFQNRRDQGEYGTAPWDVLGEDGREVYLKDARLLVGAIALLGWAPLHPHGALYLTDERDTLKALRETLCRAQTAMAAVYPDGHWIDIERLERVIAEIDRQRPLGPDGKHGDLHTPTCGCEDR